MGMPACVRRTGYVPHTRRCPSTGVIPYRYLRGLKRAQITIVGRKSIYKYLIPHPPPLIFISDSCINEPTKIVLMEEEFEDEWFPDQEI